MPQSASPVKDVLVLGAGIVGVSIALHLQKRGKTVLLVDRRAPGEETSHGNAGLIERASVIPYGCPRDIATLLKYATNRSADVRFRWTFLPTLLPWIARFWFESSSRRLRRAAVDMLPLIERSLLEHRALMDEAGISRKARHTGWIEAYRTEKAFAAAKRAAGALDEFGIRYAFLGPQDLAAREPHLAGRFAGAVHWLDPATVADPGGLVKDYAGLFARKGGEILKADATTLVQDEDGWSIRANGGVVHAREAVVALGPWSDAIYGRLGYRVPLAVKRGYHVHIEPAGDAVLNHPIVDAERGYLLAPMTKGIRLTTGIEFASRDEAPTPVQIDQTEPHARTIFPLGRRVEATPWMGARPCLPDMRPIIGPAPRHRGLWFAFGHNHHGLTLGPATGRLLAEMMTGETPFADPSPYAMSRFG
ncbi:FAD-binding oxidoreductase [Ensifer adhaerens]|uniref:NAD(P)/FAD-dependent oxidoreductase n=1 Tax=Ensifer adhaerens TaxID=106592 RepID=UPI001CC0578A|nr:FAD-binding oxidoreductase [Ensifer adhaerens]MBZ7926518.1 FAD-binding oxidoreductase [Ensifer adhaerens]UAX97140.1 FAD-binding oxidoreductase [Ensifer adhaerens]